MKKTIILFIFILGQSESILDWFWSTEKPRDIFSPSGILNVSFEELDPEEKFIAEAAKISGMEFGSLDVCQQKIVMRLKSSCGSLNEEQLAKLSVNLLNCQLSSEGKNIHTCNEKMTLKDCTKSMDSDIWNAYHIISNRARAVCYSTRQLQFRALSEMTVNRLLGTARTHLDTIEEFQKKQTMLQDASEITLKRLLMTHRDYKTSYSSLKIAENSLALIVDNNRKKVQNESKLLDDINMLMNALSSILNNTLASTKKLAGEEQKQRREEHSEFKEEFTKLKLAAATLNSILEQSILKLNERERKLNLDFIEVENRLKAINKSLGIINDLVDDSKQVLAKKLGYVNDLLLNGKGLDMFISISTHALALIFAMILSSFLSLGNIVRWVTIVGSPLNLGLSLHYNLPLFMPLLVFYSTILFIILCDIFMNVRKKPTNPVPTSLVNKAYSKVDDWLEGNNDFNKNGHTPIANKDLNYTRLRQYTPALSVASSVKTLCTGVTKKGLDCRQPAEKGSSRCWRHNVNNSRI